MLKFFACGAGLQAGRAKTQNMYDFPNKPYAKLYASHKSKELFENWNVKYWGFVSDQKYLGKFFLKIYGGHVFAFFPKKNSSIFKIENPPKLKTKKRLDDAIDWEK